MRLWRKTSKNKQWAACGRRLAECMSECGGSPAALQETQVDAVTNLLHYTASVGGDPSAVVRLAVGHFEYERGGSNG